MVRVVASAGLAGVLVCAAAFLWTQDAWSQDGSGPALQGVPAGRSPVQAHIAKLVAMCPPATRMPEAEAAKLPIAVTGWGTSGPRVLIIHGGVQGGLGGGGSHDFAGQKVLGDQGWRLEAVDRPGFGSSPSRGVDDMEADAHWIADMLGSGANLIGHSWGGDEALLAAARRPEAVKSLILVEPAVQVLLTADPALASQPAVKAATERFAAVLMKADTPAAYAIAFVSSLGAAADGGINPVAAKLKGDPKLATTGGCALLQGRLAPFPLIKQAAEAVAKAGVPVLIITGGWNPLYDMGADILARMTNGRHVIVKSPNHFVQSTSADAFNKVVIDFMRQADARTRTPG